jgi:hypothetical protein
MGRGSLGYLPGRGFRPVIANCSNGAPVTGLDRSCLIDGEAIVCDDDGLAVFDLIRRHGALASAIHCAFDRREAEEDWSRSR